MANEVENNSLITDFINITGAEESIAKNTLEACNWNLEMAINMFVDSNLAQPSAPNAVSEQPTTQSEDNIRPPIPPVQQVLVEDYPRFQSITDTFRNFEREFSYHESNLSEEQGTSSTENKRKTLDDLFRPPLDLIFQGTFERAKFEGQHSNKWLLVNIQNPQEFACQVLNRDLWSHPAVKSIIKEHFIFWQTYHESSQGQNFVSFYSANSFPHISIIDPRTGEKLMTCNEMDTVTFCEKITQFLNEHPSPTGKVNSHFEDSNQFKNKLSHDDSEQMQLEAAIKASLKDMENHTELYQDPTNINTDNWRNYIGSDESQKMEIVIRYPDGNKEKVMFPSTSKLKALFLYVTEHGFDMEKYDLITNFPKQNLSIYDEMTTLESSGLHSRDTLYVQCKD